jgi:DNA-binding transcriptional regulator YiaG
MTGEELRAAREDLGYERRQDFADLLGVSKAGLEHWEYNRRVVPAYVVKHLECINDRLRLERSRKK